MRGNKIGRRGNVTMEEGAIGKDSNELKKAKKNHVCLFVYLLSLLEFTRYL